MLFSDEDGENDYQDYDEDDRRDDNPDPIHALARRFLVLLRLHNVLLCLNCIVFCLFNVFINFDQVRPLLLYFTFDSDCNVSCIHCNLLCSVEVLLSLLNNLFSKVNLALYLQLLDIQLLMLELLAICLIV